MTLPEPPSEHPNTEGLTQVGEVTSRTMREAITEPDYEQALRAGGERAYLACIQYIQDRIASAGPYDDTRALKDLVTWLGDRIRQVHSIAMNGSD